MFVPESGISRSAALPAVPEGGGGTKMMMVDEERMIGEIQHNMSDGTNYREAGNKNKSRKRSRKRFRESVALSHNSTSTDEHGVSTKQLDKIEKLVAADIAICISNQSKTVALIAALLSSWAVTVYGGERPTGLCFGESMIHASYVVFWISLGFFFVCVSSSLAIIADLDGVPQKFLYRHFKQKVVRITYQIPEFTMMLGVICLAVAYAMDVGERAGCAFFYFGCVASLAFVVVVAILFWLLKRARMQLHRDTDNKAVNPPLGNHVIATWRDRLDYCLVSEDAGIDIIGSTRHNSMGSGIDIMNTMRRSTAAAVVE